MTHEAPRLIAFYLPQFHPIPENDQWWGKGFTEWTNVAPARPLFRGHYQPHVPADLGFYDLRLPEIRQQQADLAREYGIAGFCYYHYWFGGRRLLERPFEEVLASGRPDFPFCLCWANETWSRRWLGEEKAVLMKQEYSPEDDERHADWLTEAFRDPRHIRVKGRPLFLVYRPKDHPQPAAFVATLRQASVRKGMPAPYLLGVDAHCNNTDCRSLGFDGTVHFQPRLGSVPGAFRDGIGLRKLVRNVAQGIVSTRLKICDDARARRHMAKYAARFPAYPTVFVGWDNTPRRGQNAIILTNSSPGLFARSLRKACDTALRQPLDEPIVFVNAWNEWAEGNHLEPDQRYGRAYLEAVREVLSELRHHDRSSGAAPVGTEVRVAVDQGTAS